MLPTPKQALYPALEEYLNESAKGWATLTEDRKALLNRLADYIRTGLEKEGPVYLNFICTHNSRRSHLTQLWAAALAWRAGLTQVQTYSGGTEATAFNPRAVAAMRRAGFLIPEAEGDNPRYAVQFADAAPAATAFSKTFDHADNPATGFAAVMTCSDADQNCPFIPGATRIKLTYEDPKVADDTPEEQARYDERTRQITTELSWCFAQV